MCVYVILIARKYQRRSYVMEIKPQKNYKKPVYAVGLASLIATAGTLTGCTDNSSGSSSNSGQNNSYEHSSLSGDMIIITDATSAPIEYDGGLELVGEVEFDDSSIPEETEILELDGDVVCPPDNGSE